MTIKAVSVIKGLGISMLAGALLLSAQPVASAGRTVAASRIAQAVSPNTVHHWFGMPALADLDPFTFHHWA